jgi:predicted AlkP superfamily pyrophosphatase or phosphodiesterase
MAFPFMRKITFLPFFIFYGILYAQDTTQHIIPGRSNSHEHLNKPYVILISADGFRYDLADTYQAKNLIRLRSSGVAADYMQSVFPSLTFPNHYSIATGSYPDHDGIVDNSFYDPSRKQVYSMSNKNAVEDSSWYGATPLWVLAEKQGMLTASYYWVGAEAAIQGVRPTYFFKFNSQISMKERIRGVRDWLQLPENIRPHLITFYIPDVDHQEHMYGVHSSQTEEAVHYVDDAIGSLVQTIDSLHLPVNYIFVSDHGMADLDTLHGLSLPTSIDTNSFTILSSLSIVHMYAKDKSAITPAYQILKNAAKDYDVYLATEMPERWHYNKKNDRYNRIGDIILVAHAPKAFKLSRRSLPAATHGFDPATTAMHASFYAWGPAFKSNLKIRGFENIHIYPLITDLLQLKITEPVDGKLTELKSILKGTKRRK